MASERFERQVDRLLDEAEEAVELGEWVAVRDYALKALVIDPHNQDAREFLAIAERGLDASTSPIPSSTAAAPPVPTDLPPSSPTAAMKSKAS